MLRSVSGPHIQKVNSDDARALFSQKFGCIKICDDPYIDLMRVFHEVNPGSPVDCRLIHDSANFDNMRALTQKAIKIFEPLLAFMPPELIFVEILPNEKYCNGEELRRLSEATVECAYDISDAGMRPVGFNIPVGNPADMSQVAFMWDGAVALLECDGLIGYHNYTIPSKQLDTYLDLRHERWRPLLPLGSRFALNEGLYDHGIIDGRLAGWRDESFHLTATDTAAYVAKIAEKLASDDSVVFWTPFGAGPTPDWHSFQYDNEPVIIDQLKKYWEVNLPPTPVPVPEYQPERLCGTDISSHQGPNVNLKLMYDVGQVFTIIKTSEINENGSYINPYFKDQWAACAEAQLVRGGYIFGQPDYASPIETIELFDEALQSVGGLYEGDLVALDMEAGTGDLLQWTIQTLDALQRKYGFKPYLYSNYSFMQEHGLMHSEIARLCHLWLADWDNSPPVAQAPFTEVKMWQYTAHGKVPGVSGDCDQDVFFGTLDELIATGAPAR